MTRRDGTLDLLVVDDERAIRAMFARMHARYGPASMALRTAGSLDEAIAALDCAVPDILLFDVCMPSRDHALRLVDAAYERALPRLLAMSGRTVGSDGLADIVALGPRGVVTIYDKTDTAMWNEGMFERIARDASARPTLLAAAARGMVGTVGMIEARAMVTDSMVDEAVAKARSSRAAARLLGVSRQALQQRRPKPPH